MPQRTNDGQARLLEAIKKSLKKARKPVNLMEICGTHTMDISRYGLRKLLPDSINLVSGPGCPVCVTPIEEINRAIELARLPGAIVATFGDMMRVPGTRSTLNAEKSKGADIRVVYSPFEALKMADENPGKPVIFIGIGFETTAPAIALAIKQAKKGNINNFYVLAAFKTVIPAMNALLADKELKIDGFIAPGHVSTIIGADAYEPVAKKYNAPCVITGFEAEDILQGILMLVRQHAEGRGEVEIQYGRAVKKQGNKAAQAVMKEVFRAVDSNWRGIGVIPLSGLALNSRHAEFDALQKFKPKAVYSKEPAGCRCGDVLKGLIKPVQCGLFGKTCTPGHPVGACMVSSEGSCAAYFKYERTGERGKGDGVRASFPSPLTPFPSPRKKGVQL